MRIEYAEPGTDPTQIPSKRARIGPAAFFQDNWMLMIGVLIFVVMGARKFLGDGKDEAVTAVVATPAPVVAEAQPQESGLPGWCELNGTLIPPGEHQVGNDVRRCLEGLWFTDAEDTP